MPFSHSRQPSEPDSAPYEPASHFVHVLLAALEYVPLAHDTHEAAPVFEYVPPTQTEQLEEPVPE